MMNEIESYRPNGIRLWSPIGYWLGLRLASGPAAVADIAAEAAARGFGHQDVADAMLEIGAVSVHASKTLALPAAEQARWRERGPGATSRANAPAEQAGAPAPTVKTATQRGPSDDRSEATPARRADRALFSRG